MTPQERFDELVALYGQMQFGEMVLKAEQLASEFPTAFAVWNLFAAGHSALGNLSEAEFGFRKSVELNPEYPEGFYNLGITLHDQRRFDDAVTAYQRAIALYPDYALAHFNLGNSLREQGKFDEALPAFEQAARLNPAHAEALNNAGIVLWAMNQFGAAVSAYRSAIEIRPSYAEAFNNMGTALQELGRLKDAIAAYQRAIDLDPNYAVAEAHKIYAQQMVCDFGVSARLQEASSRLGIATKATSPFASLSWEDDPKNQRLRAITWANELCAAFPGSHVPLNPRKAGKLRVGLFSADIRLHPMMQCIAGLLRHHDRNAMEFFVYSFYRGKADGWREKVSAQVETFIDASSLSDQMLIDCAVSHGLDIAIDLTGYTAFSRSAIFQSRLAPIQINFLGFPGTMGAEFMDYMVADEVVVPEDQRRHYSEKIIYLPHSYFPIDYAHNDSASDTNRMDHGLPEDAVVLCCFNNSYKISAREFQIWMRILSQVDGSVLWVLKANEWAEANLRQAAIAHGIDAQRLIFAEKVDVPRHLERQRHADIFVDTFNYNAHTTACDALWGGLPVVTKLGKQFPARVAASVLMALGLPELVTTTEEDYEALILKLATDSESRADLKQKIAKHRATYPLFDAVRYTRNFEKGLRAVHNLHLQGQAPRDVRISEQTE